MSTEVLKIEEKSIAEHVLNRVKVFEEAGSLNLPKNYSAANAIRVAWLIILDTKDVNKAPVLNVCTGPSIANALFKMVIQGLNPVKRQCSFIAYGNQLTCQKEYQGTIAIAKRHGVASVTGAAVFKDDVFNYIKLEDGNDKVIKHEQTIESIDTGIVKAAYAIKEYADGKRVCKVMSMSQIKKAWMQGRYKG
ncbi:MAG: recombinase RecT [Agriterribacter sp.]